MLTDPFFYLVAIPAVLISGIAKGGFGGGLGVLSVPLLTLMMAPTQAAAIMLPILCVMDVIALWNFRGKFDRKNLLILLPAALLGITIGALTFQYMNDDHLRILIGATTLTFCIHWFWNAIKKQDIPAQQASVKRGGLLGTLAGFTSFSVHAGGPPISFYLLPQKLDKSVFVGTTVILFTAINYMKLVPYAFLDLLPVANLTTSFVLLPLAVVGVKLGLYLHKRVNQALFYRFCYVFLFITGCKLSWDGLSGVLI